MHAERALRSKESQALCNKFSGGGGCMTTCPISSECAMKTGDTYAIWVERTNKAAAGQ